MLSKGNMKRWFWPKTQANEKVLYYNARIVDPASKIDMNGHLLTHGETIVERFSSQQDPEQIYADKKINCDGDILIPGLVDIHVHFREPGYENKETIETGSKAAVAGGVTTVVCQPNTKPKIESVNVIRYILSRPSYNNIEFYASATREIDGSLTDMNILHSNGACGFTDDGLPIVNSLIMKQAFLYSRALKVPIAQHAEDPSYSGCMNEGRISEELALTGNPNISESMIVSRDIQILRTVEGARYHVLHVSTKESLDAIEQAKKEGLQVSCEVAPHHLFLTDTELRGYNCLGKVNPPLRSEDDRLAMIKALKDGIIDCIASDHAPHDPPSKETTLEKAAFGMVGVELLLPLSLELYHNKSMGLSQLLANLTYKPAKIINKNIGNLKNGSRADLALVVLDREWSIRNDNLSGMSKNSPYDGRKVKGKVRRTVVRGQTVFEDDFQKDN